MSLLLIHSILVTCSVWQINLNIIFIILTRLIILIISLAIDHLLILLVGKYLLFINCIIAAILTLSSIYCLLRCKHLVLNILKCTNRLLLHNNCLCIIKFILKSTTLLIIFVFGENFLVFEWNRLPCRFGRRFRIASKTLVFC